MSIAVHPAIALRVGGEAIAVEPAGGRRLARQLCQAIVLLPLFSLILLPEYVQGLGDPDMKSILYRGTIGPLRIVDALLLIVIAVHGAVWASSRKMRLHIPRSLVLPGLGFLAATAVAMIFGWLHGGTNLFFDWRALALGVGMYGVFAAWVQTPAEARSAMQLFAGCMAVRIGLIYATYLRGGGDVIVGVRIPLFDGPTLSAIVFTAVLALWMSDCARGGWRRLQWMSLSTAAFVLVLLCFRRTFWAELGIATFLLLLMQKRWRARKLLFASAIFVAGAVMLGPNFVERMQSMDFTTDESEFSQGNPDHVGEVLDAWDEVQRQPLLGIGLGRSYPTLRIQNWKEESVMVHNAPLHVWLKYGLMGLSFYVWFHFALFRWLHQQCNTPPAATEDPGPRISHRAMASSLPSPDHRTAQSNEKRAWTGAALAYLTAQFVVSLGFTPWPYSSTQSTILTAFVLAVAIAGTNLCQFQPSPS